MSLGEFLGRLARALDRAAVDYMFCGSVASTYHGIPRTTQDIDLVVALRPGDLRRLLEVLPEAEYYISEEAARSAIRSRGQFNVIDLATGWKADLIVRKARRFSAEEFGRRVRAGVMGAEVWIASAEDTILAKLEWAARGGGSERQLRDVRGIVAMQRAALDWEYMSRWGDVLGIDEAVAALLVESNDPE